MKYIKEYLEFEENFKILIDLLEDSELDFQYRICQIKNINKGPYMDNGAYFPPEVFREIEAKDFEVIRIQIALESNNENDSLLSQIVDIIRPPNPILRNAISTLVELKKIRNNSLLKRIQNLSDMTLIYVEWVRSRWLVGLDFDPDMKWDEPKEFLILDFTHSENILNP